MDIYSMDFICALGKINVNFEGFEEFQGIFSAKQ